MNSSTPSADTAPATSIRAGSDVSATVDVSEELSDSGPSRPTRASPRAGKKKAASSAEDASDGTPAGKKKRIILLDSPVAPKKKASVSTRVARPLTAPASAPVAEPFRLDAFTASFSGDASRPLPRPQGPPPAKAIELAVTPVVDNAASLAVKDAEISALKAQLAFAMWSRPATDSSPDISGPPAHPAPFALFGEQRVATAPNSKGALPPAEICELTPDSFPKVTNIVRGDYQPTDLHMLSAARALKVFTQPEGKWTTSMFSLMSVRNHPAILFNKSPAVLQALFSGRLGNRGATIMTFKEQPDRVNLELGSSNANFSMDFGSTAQLPTTTPNCASYEDLLDALHGLGTFGHLHWFDHVRSLLTRLHAFVSRNKSADADNTPARVKLTREWVDRFIGLAFACLQDLSSGWWPDYCTSLRQIDYENPKWTMAVVDELTRIAQAPRAVASTQGPVQAPWRRPQPPSSPKLSKFTAMPARIRELIPTNDLGQQPCLRFLSGNGCSGENCDSKLRVHKWASPLPRELQQYIEARYAKKQDTRRRY